MTSVESGMPPAEPPAAADTDLLDTRAAGPAALRGSVLRTGAYVAGILLTVVSARVLITHLGVSTFGRYLSHSFFRWSRSSAALPRVASTASCYANSRPSAVITSAR